MRYEDLSAADKQLLNTDLGEIEKEASAQIALADEMYNTGFYKLAQEAADSIEEAYAADQVKVAADLNMDDESEKTAQDLSQFIERGFFDGLRKLGSERYGDEMAYIVPFIEEKVAAAGAQMALDKLAGKAKAEANFVRKGWDATKDYFKKHNQNAGKASEKIKSLKSKIQDVAPSDSKKLDHLKGQLSVERKKYWGGRAMQAAPAAAVGGVAGGATLLGVKGHKRHKEKEALRDAGYYDKK